MRMIETEIEINAAPEKVWEILVDLDRYNQWNPFIKEASGKIDEGGQLDIFIEPPGSTGMRFKPTVKSVAKNSQFSWLGRLWLPGIFDGEHIFIIIPNEKGCRLVQKEKFSGLLVPLLWSSLDKDTRAGFILMNDALKERAETEES